MKTARPVGDAVPAGGAGAVDQMIKAALFDVYGTCVDWRSGVTGFAKDMLTDKGLPADQAVYVAEEWRKLYDPFMEQVRSGKRNYVPLDVIQRENLDLVLEKLGLAADFDETDRQKLNSAWDQLPAWPDTVECLSKLGNVIPIAACSNGSRMMMQRLADHNRIDWSMICGADIGQTFKPEPVVYQRSCEALGSSPGQTIMIACHPSDLDAADCAGLKTGYFPRPLEWGRSDFEPDPNPARFTLHAGSFSELVDQIIAEGT